MNRIYKVIFNTSLGLYQVVSEIARNHGKSSSGAKTGRKSVMVPFIVAALLALPVGTGALAADTDTSPNTQTNTVVTVKDGDQLQGTGAASVTSTTTKDDTSGTSTTTITINVPNDGKVESGNTGLVTGGMVYAAVNAEQTAREAGDTTLTNKIGTLDANGNYIQKDASVSSNLSTLDTRVKTNADAISTEKTDRETAVTNVTNTVSSLSDSAVKYDSNTNKTKVTLAGEGGTTISNVKDGALSDSSTEAVTGKQLYAEQSARTAADTAITNRIGALSANGNYIQKDASVSSNLSTLDTQVKTNADAISKETTDRETAVSNEITARTKAISDLKMELTTGTNSSLASKANVNATNIDAEVWGEALGAGAIASGDVKLLSGGTLFTELRPSADGTYSYISSKNTTAVNLKSLDSAIAALGVEMLTDKDGKPIQYTSSLFKYFKVNPEFTANNTNGTKTYAADAAANGTNSVAIGPNAKTAQYTTTTTSGDTTTTTETAADHAVAIGDGATVNAAGDKGLAIGNGASVGEAESTTTSGTTTTITDAKGGASSAAIGDRAVANGNTSVALGANAQVLNTTDQDGKTTATITGSTAVGSGAKVNGVTDATAIGTSAQVNETATGGIAFGKNAVTGEDKGTVTVSDVTANVAAVGGENSVALGTDAKASGNTALALGKGAQVNNYTTQSGTTVTKTVNSGSTAIGSSAVVTGANDAVALGTGASVTGTGDDADDSLAIGKSASVATAKDAMALGTSAAVKSGANNAVAIGNTAKANTANTTAIGYNASATGAGAIAIGENTATSTEGGISIGSGTSVSGRSIAIGYSTDGVTTGSDNTDAVAIGNGAQAYANDSISIGHQAGKGTNEGRTSGYGSLIAIGTNAGANVKGMQNVAMGSGAGSNVKSSYNVAIGSNAGSGINYAADSNPQDGYNISIGYEANYQSADANAKNIKESIAIGHSANAVSEATALGTGAAASGDKSMALGYNAAAADTDSIALGDNASAGGGNIAIGSGSQAPAVTSYSKGYLTNSSSVNGYISVGGTTSATGTTVLRRISNVADGAADQDAVTVAQLKAAYTDLEGTIKTTDTKISDTYTQSAIDSKISTVESKITASQTKYFSINPSSDTLTANANNDGASTTGAADAMAIGPNATATSAKAVAIGNNVSASGKGSIALGTADNPATRTTVTEGGNTSANPHVTSAEGANSVAIGTSAIAQTDNSVALGTRASVYTSNVTDSATNTTVKVGQQSIAIGYESETRNSNATSIGSGAKAYSDGSTAIGHSAYAQGADSVVIGTSSTANGASSGIVGKSNTINGSNTYAVGSENNVNGNWGAVTYSGLYGSKNNVNPVSDTSGNTKHGMDSLSITGNSNTISQGSYSDTVQNISILGNSNSVTGANTDEANAGTTANITVIGGNNEVTGRDGAGSDYMGKTWNQLTRTSIIGYGNTVNQAQSTISLANTQILGNDVTATLGNSVYLGTGAAAKTANLADATTLTDAEQAAVDALDTTGMTDAEKATAQANAKATARYATNLKAMKASGTTAGLQTLNTDTTYDDGTSYTYAGSNPAGVITVGSAGSERRIQNVAAGLVSATSTDAVNGSQLYALTRQLRFGGDNSSFGTTTADDKNVVARGSNETLSIIGGETDSTKLTDKNIGVVADSTNNTLTVKLSKNVNLGTDGSVVTGNTTLDNTGLAIANGPKFTSSGIDAANQQIHRVTAGTDDADAANVGQVNAAAAAATTEVKAGTNASLGTVETNANDKHKIYTVNVDNLAVKANGTGNTTVALAKGINFVNGTNTTSAVDASGNVTIDTKNLALKANGTNTATVTMDNGINFKNGTNTTATVGADGTVTISATHNKLDSASYTASKPSDTSNQTTVKLKDTDGNETTLNLTDTYTSVSKNTDHTITFKRNDGSDPVSISLDDLNGASKEALTTAAAKATTTVIKGNNVDSVEDDTTSADGHHIYKVNVSNLGVKVADGQKKSVALSDGLVFCNGTNTTASVGDNGAITFNVSNEAIKTQAKDAINMTAGSNVKVETATSTDGLSKTFTISATHNTLKSATLTKGANDVSTLTITGNDGDTASVDIKNTYLTVSKDTANKTVTFTSNDGKTLATTLSLSDFGAASTTDMTAAVAKATTEVKAGTNATLGTLEMDPTDQHKIYTVNVENLGVSQNGTKVGTGVYLKDGLNFTDGTNTTASVAENGTISYSVSNDAIKAQAKNAVMVAAGDNVSIDAPTDANNVKTYTVRVNDLKLQANGADKGTRKLAEGINFANGKNITAAVEDGKVVYSLNDALTDLTSVTAKDTTGNQTLVSGSGVTITPAVAGAQPVSLTTSGLSMGNQQITNVQSGGDTDTNAANISDVKRLVKESASGTTETGFNVKGDDATAQKVKLGKQLNVVGGTNDASKLSNNNIGVVTTADADGNATLTVKLNKAIALDSVTAGSSVLSDSGLTITDGPKFTKNGIDAGSQRITGVANGENANDAVNKGQLDALTNTVNGGWNLAGKNSDGTAVTAKIGAGKTVIYDNGNYTKAVVTKDDSNNATVKVDVTTGTFGSGTGDKAGTVTAKANGLATTEAVANAINSAYWTIQDGNNTGNAQQVKAGDTVTFDAGNNIVLTQSGTSFTYGLTSDVNTNSIRLGGSQDTNGRWTGGIFIGKQIGGGANQSEGNYITGLDNTSWDLSKVVDNRAATEAQLKEAINQITLKEQNGGFALTGETGSDKVSQTLGNSIAIVGDTEYENDGKTVKTQGNITTEADSTNVGGIKIKLNKDITLGNNGSLTIGSSSVTNGQAKIGSVTVNGTDNTVSGLSNTKWDEATAKADGYKNSNKAATESQLQAVYDQATSTATANEQHIKAGTYDIQTRTDTNGNKQSSVTMDIVDGAGNNKGTVVINDVAKASDVGDTDKLAADIKNQNGGQPQSTSVVEAINNLNDKVGDKNYTKVEGKEIADGESATTAIGKLNNRMNDIYQTAGQHTTVSNTDKNLEIKPTTDDKGKTNYEINLSKQVNLGNVQLDGDKGSIEAKSMKADSFTAGSTVVGKDGVKIGDKIYVDNNGLNANGNAIHNVGEGKEDTDAVNVKQVNDLAARQGEAITENAAHISQLGQAVNKLDNRINRVGAGAAALAALHPGDYDPDDKLDVSAGVGNYRGANAAAVGLFFHPNERTILSVAGSMGGGENMVNAGVTLKVGPGHGTPTTVTTKTGQKVDVMDILAKQTEILEKLAGNTKAASAPAGSDIFPDVPQNHWAYAYVDKLYRAGSLAGFSEPGKLKSHMLTRKDFAEILYWAMTNGATTNPDLNGDGSLNRLAAEFGAELKLVVK